MNSQAGGSKCGCMGILLCIKTAAVNTRHLCLVLHAFSVSVQTMIVGVDKSTFQVVFTSNLTSKGVPPGTYLEISYSSSVLNL